jgi:hypothetical protein
MKPFENKVRFREIETLQVVMEGVDFQGRRCQTMCYPTVEEEEEILGLLQRRSEARRCLDPEVVRWKMEHERLARLLLIGVPGAAKDFIEFIGRPRP